MLENILAPETSLEVANTSNQDSITSLELVKQINFFREAEKMKEPDNRLFSIDCFHRLLTILSLR